MKLNRPSRRIGIITLISIIAVLLAGVYTWQSLRAWSNYETRLLSEQKTYEDLRKEALGADSPEKRLAAIRALDDKLAKRSELCDMNGLYAWQAAIIPALKVGVQECDEKVKRLGLVAGPLKALREYLEASAKVQEAVRRLAPGEALNDGNWTEKGLERAKDFQAELKGLSLTGDAAKLKDQALKLSDSLVTTWDSLIKANDAKDKTAFLSASAAVAKAYADFMSLADEADAQIQRKVDAVSKAASNV